jgi:hypothetical protein
LLRRVGFWWLLLAPLTDIAVLLFGVPVATYWHLAYHDNHDTGLMLTKATIIAIAIIPAVLLDLALQALLDRVQQKGNAHVSNVSVQ